MKKTIYALVILISCVINGILTSNSYAQAPATSFTAHAGNSGVDDGWGIGSDANGNIYACGGFNGSITFGTTTLNSTGGRDMYLVKYDSAGTVQWARKGGGASASERGRAIAVDASGNSYVTGYFYSSATFGNITVTSNGGYDVYLAKYNSSGTIQWVKSIGGTLDEDEAFDVALDASGNSFVVGYFKGTATFSSGVTLTSSGGTDIYIMKHNSSGVFQWVKKAGGSGNDYGYGCVVDPSGNIGITGVFNGTATFYPGISITSSGYADIFIAKYHGPTGTFLFAKKAGGSFTDEARGMNCDNNGNFYITGNYKGTATFGVGTGATNLTSTTEMYGSNPSIDIFTAKYNNSGIFKWAKTAGGARDEGGRDVACDDFGNVNITGYFEGNITFGTYSLLNVASNPSFAYEDPFAAQYDSSGTFNWAVHGGSGWHDAGYGIATDPWGNVLITGTINPDGTTINWNGMAFSGATNSNNGHDIFIAKMGNASGPPPLAMILSKTDITCKGFNDGTASVQASGGTQIYSYLWSTGDTITTLNGLSAGTYILTITDTSNASIIDSVTIIEPQIITAGLSKTDVNCFGNNDGTISTNTTGGSSPFSYLWSNADTTQNISNLLQGYYSVTITDGNNCTTTDSIQINEPIAINTSIYSHEETVSLNDGMAWVIVNGGTPGYSYLWSDVNMQTNDTAFNLVAGLYNIVITDANQCTDSVSVIIADSTTVGILDLEKTRISIYPNPASKNLFVESSKQIVSIGVFDCFGRELIFKDNINNKKAQLNCEDLIPGIYFIKLQFSNNTTIRKLVVE